MIKDPLFTEETPYEFLELNTNVTHNEVHNTLSRFLRKKKNISKLNKAQESIKKLKDSYYRMTIDILYYNINAFLTADMDSISLKEFINHYLQVPILSLDDFYTDIEKEDFSKDFSEIKYRKIIISKISKFNNISTLKFNVQIDK